MINNHKLEIDGLRAISVSAVILYHLQVSIFGHQIFKGGFIGIDIFFVISGYLTTLIILKELLTTGTFSFIHFYERRIRRILPALILVMLVSLPFAWMYLLPTTLVNYLKSIITLFSFSSNFYFHYSGNGFGETGSLSKPFLHTWSLSVLVQYYIIFPLVLLILFKYFKKFLIYILILGFFISLGLADWASKNHQSLNFYILPTRGWELLAGSILAYYEIKFGHRSKQQTLNLILPSIGLILIGHSILSFNDKMFHPSFYSLSPIIGVCFIIWFSNPNEIITKILSTKLFVGVGLISYSLYLWHYPIFAFDKVVGLTDKYFYIKYFLIFISIFFSIFSYFFLEKKFRDKRFKFNKILPLIIISYLFFLIIFFIAISNGGFKKRFNDILNSIDSEEHVFYLLKSDEEGGVNCMDYFYCSSNNNSDKKVFLLGDSHMAAISFDLNKKLINRDYKFIPLTMRGCYFFRNFEKIDNKNKKIIGGCTSSEIEKRYELIKKNPNSIIIIGGMLPYHISGTIYKKFLDNDYERDFEYKSKLSDDIKVSFMKSVFDLSKNNKVVLIYPYPEISFSTPKKIIHKFFLEKKQISEILGEKFLYEPFDNYLRRSKEAFDLLNLIKNENIYRIYPHLLICQTVIKDGCITHNETEIFYSDIYHPSTRASEMINEQIMKVIEKIELKSN